MSFDLIRKEVPWNDFNYQFLKKNPLYLVFIEFERTEATIPLSLSLLQMHIFSTKWIAELIVNKPYICFWFLF